MFSIANKVGRLGELRIGAQVSLEELTPFRARLASTVQSLKTRVVFCGDLRATRVLPQPVTDAFIALMKVDNGNIERSGFLVSNAMFGNQIERMVQEARNPARRVFHKRDAMETWLGEVLTPAELARAREFLAEGDGK